ncbi:MAG: LysR family transcriptional regulator [Nitrospirae bacterium]|nr:LysR family transcriptional regulator [Nitrospirota bacterium]MBI3392648.1 LysR family transcriptional regulator [Nitrospirota bacterium]
MIDLEWLRSFAAIYRLGTVSSAAGARYLTQPAVSQHLAALEAAIGQPLFGRTPRRMVPTERGKELYSRVAQSLDTLERVLRRPDGAAPEKPIVRVGSPQEYFYETALPRLAGATCRLWVEFGPTPELLERLERGELDLVIATQRLSTRGIEYGKAADERFILVGSPEKMRFGGRRPRPADLDQVERWLAGLDWISYGVELPIVRRFWQEVFHRRPEIRPVLVIPSLHAILKAVELGYGVSLLPDYLCRGALSAGRLRELWKPPMPVANELWFAFRKTDRHREEILRLRERLTGR